MDSMGKHDDNFGLACLTFFGFMSISELEGN